MSLPKEKISASLILVCCLQILMAVCSCSGPAQKDSGSYADEELANALSKDLDMLLRIIESGNYEQADRFTDSITSANSNSGIQADIIHETAAGYLATAEGNVNKAFNHFEKARIAAEELGDQGKIYSAMVYNGLGRYYLELLGDISSAIQSFSIALDFQEQSYSDEADISKTLLNLAYAYAEAKDTTGLSFAVEAFNGSNRSGDIPVIINSGLKAAYFHTLNNGIAEAEKYLRLIDKMVKDSDNPRFKAELWSRYGSLYEIKAMTDSALYCYSRAIDLSENSKPYEQVGMMLNKGNLLYLTGHPADCAELLNRALRIAGKHKVIYQSSEIFNRLADCHNAMNNHRQAAWMMFVYKNFEDSIHSISRDRIMNMLRIRDEVLLHKLIIQKQETDLKRKERNTTIIMSVCLLLLIIVGFMVYLYFKKRHLFAIIIRQNLDYENRQRELKEYISELQSADKYNGNIIPDNKIDNIMRSLDELLSDESVITDPGLSLSFVAERLGTNRTYLSQAVKEATGDSFPTLIRSRRIKKAIELISRPDSNLPVKEICRLSGFSSMSAFHSAFRNETGMTPNIYRNELNRQR